MKVSVILDIGLRRKYFLFLLILLTATVAFSSAIQIFFFSNERRQLVDQQIEATASALIASGFSAELLDNLDEVDDLLKDILGEVRVDQIINIFNSDGSVLYRNLAGTQLPIEFIPHQRWLDLQINDHDIRILIIKSQEFYIQVGLVLDTSNKRWFSSGQRMLSLIGFMFLVIVALSYKLSRSLFMPVQKIAQEFSFLTSQIRDNIGHANYVFEIPDGLKKYSKNSKDTDEINQLATEINNFLLALADFSKNVQSQAAILTHELKTPLTVLYSCLEKIETASTREIQSQQLVVAKKLVKELAETVNGFLRWAVFSAREGQSNEIYAIKITEIANEVFSELGSLYPGRIDKKMEEDFVVFCQREHLKQVLRNLLENALKYSESDKKIQVEIQSQKLRVVDSGAGIPEMVVRHLGSPFNRGPNQNNKSVGLGLAWVHAICRRYNWKLQVQSSSSGTQVGVDFSV